MAKKKVEIPVKLIELEKGNYHLLVKARFEKGDSVYWVIDTGASKSVFDINKSNYFTVIDLDNKQIRSAGIGEGHIETKAARLSKFYLGKQKISGLEVALISLDHVNQLYKEFSSTGISGLLGSDFLLKYEAIINYKKRILKLKI